MANQRKPTSPGEILNEEFLIPLKITQKQLADHIGCDVKVINRIINQRSAVSAEVALKLGSTLKTSADFWLNAQKAVDLFKAHKKIETLPEPIQKVG